MSQVVSNLSQMQLSERTEALKKIEEEKGEDISRYLRLFVSAELSPIDDLERLISRLEKIETAKDLLVYSSKNRGSASEEADFFASGAFWASLASYRRDGEAPQDDFCGRIDEVTYLLDRVRDELMRLVPSTRVALRAAQQSVTLARAWTALILALDAAGDADR